MKKHWLIACLVLIGLNTTGWSQKGLELFRGAVFYNGYAALITDSVPSGVIRLRNDLVTTKLAPEILQEIGAHLTVQVTLKVHCDNYDRQGSVNLALVPKGASDYLPDSVQRIEVGRFITPFMDKNKTPDTVVYTFNASHLIGLLSSQDLLNNYDFWMETELFGVPFAARNEIPGCKDREDVYEGTMTLLTGGERNHMRTPYFRTLSFKSEFNNFTPGASDEQGKTVRTIAVEIPEMVYHARLYLITSNHGANDNGEEYVRRWHYVQWDNDTVLTYLPGGKTCEYYRGCNTQRNGIYEACEHTEAWWTEWNNWCPGDVIPVRTIDLGTLNPGKHTFRISVPEARFVGQNGNFPLSVFLMGSPTPLVILGN